MRLLLILSYWFSLARYWILPLLLLWPLCASGRRTRSFGFGHLSFLDLVSLFGLWFSLLFLRKKVPASLKRWALKSHMKSHSPGFTFDALRIDAIYLFMCVGGGPPQAKTHQVNDLKGHHSNIGALSLSSFVKHASPMSATAWRHHMLLLLLPRHLTFRRLEGFGWKVHTCYLDWEQKLVGVIAEFFWVFMCVCRSKVLLEVDGSDTSFSCFYWKDRKLFITSFVKSYVSESKRGATSTSDSIFDLDWIESGAIDQIIDDFFCNASALFFQAFCSGCAFCLQRSFWFCYFLLYSCYYYSFYYSLRHSHTWAPTEKKYRRNVSNSVSLSLSVAF